GPGAGVLTLAGNGFARLLEVNDETPGPIDVAISGLTLSRGNAFAGFGGAVVVANEALTLRGVAVTDNTAGNGGGIFVGESGRLTLEDSTVSNNSATGTGGFGGGVYLNGNSVGVIRSSTISGNSAVGGGGGIDVDPGGSLTVEGSTISANRAVGV